MCRHILCYIAVEYLCCLWVEYLCSLGGSLGRLGVVLGCLGAVLWGSLGAALRRLGVVACRTVSGGRRRRRSRRTGKRRGERPAGRKRPVVARRPHGVPVELQFQPPIKEHARMHARCTAITDSTIGSRRSPKRLSPRLRTVPPRCPEGARPSAVAESRRSPAGR